MFKFKGFKVTLNLSSKKPNKEQYNETPEVFITGAYRLHREDFFDTYKIPEPQKVTPSKTQRRPKSEQIASHSKSTTNLTKKNVVQSMSNSTPNISTDPKGTAPKETNSKPRDDKERKKIEKQKQADKKKQKQEQIKQEKLRKEREKEAAKKAKKDKEKKTAPRLNPLAQPNNLLNQATNPLAHSSSVSQELSDTQTEASRQYSTNTLESSISKVSGPPPYSELPTVANASDNSGNTSFSKPINSGSSWDMIAHHRQQINRPPVQAKQAKQTELYYDSGADIEARRKSLYV